MRGIGNFQKSLIFVGQEKPTKLTGGKFRRLRKKPTEINFIFVGSHS